LEQVLVSLLAVSLALLRQVLLSLLQAPQPLLLTVLLPKFSLAIPLQLLPVTLESPQVLPLLKLLLLQTFRSVPLIEPLTVQPLGWEGCILTSRRRI
jgi:hypothetical protein